MVGGALVPLNSTMIAVALPAVARDTGVSASRAAVLVTAYLVAMLAFQPLGGRAGDRYGSRSVALWALLGFGVSSLVAAAAPTFVALLAGRCLQAAFGSAVGPNLQALLRLNVEPERRGRAFGLMGSGIGAGAAVGPIVGGVLVAGLTWRAVFFVNVPVVVAAILLLLRMHPAHAVAAEGERRVPARQVILRRSFLSACVTQASSNYAMYTLLLLLPLLLEAEAWSSGTTGLAVSVLTLGMLALAPAGGYLGDRIERRTVVVAGMAIVVVGCGVVLGGLGTPALLVAGALVVGCGQGIAGASLQAAALESVPASATASAAGVFSTSRYVGSIIGSVLLASQEVAGPGTARLVAAGTVAAAVIAAGGAVGIRPGTG